MFKITNNEITITRGDTGRFTLNVLNAQGEPYDYSSDTVTFTVKKSTTTSQVLIQKTVLYGQPVIIEPADTAELNYGKYVFDVQLTTGGGGIVDTVITPTAFVVTPEVTF